MKKLLYLIPVLLLTIILTSCINTNSITKDIHEYHSSYNEEYHYNLCECGEIKDKEPHTFTKEIIYNPTCEAEGKAKYTCSCGYSYEEAIEALGHKPLTVNGTEASCDNTGLSDGLICETCGKTLKAQDVLSKLNHEFSEWEIDTPATCISKGKEKRECEHCHLEEYRDIEMIPHSYVTGDSEESTCTHHGNTADSHCSYCGVIQTASQELPLKEHEYEYSKTINTPTYIAEGLDEYKCKNCDATKTVVTNRLEYTTSMFKSSVSSFDNMEAIYTLIDTTRNVNVTVTIINKDSVKFAKVINNITNQENEYYLSNGIVVEKIPQGYKHTTPASSEDLYSIYYAYLNNAFKNAPGTNELVFDSNSNSYTVVGNLTDYNYTTQNNSIATITIDSNGKALAYSFDSANVKLTATLNYSPSTINVPTAHYHTFNYDDNCVVCGTHVDKYQAYKDNFIITYYVYSDGSIQYEYQMDNEEDPVPTFSEPTLYKSTEYNLVRITQSYTVNDVSKTFYVYKINNTILSEYESDNLESELDTIRVGETDNAILPDGTRAHLAYKMGGNLYIKVYQEGLSESQVILKGNVFNISGQKGNFYIWFQNESDNKMYKLNYNFNIIITEVY